MFLFLWIPKSTTPVLLAWCCWNIPDSEPLPFSDDDDDDDGDADDDNDDNDDDDEDEDDDDDDAGLC